MSLRIGLCGNKGCGKSTVSDYLCTRYGFVKVSFAGPLKSIAKIFGFTDQQVNGTQEDKLQINALWGICAREFMQTFGTDICRDQFKSIFPSMSEIIWIKLFDDFVNNHQDMNICCDDVRFPDEVDAIRKYQRSIVIKIMRGMEEYADVFSSHPSETSLHNVDYDYIVYNDGSIEDLHRHIDKLLDKIMNRQNYVKIIGNNYGNYSYRVGLNTLKHNNEVFDPKETCGPGGLYYTTPQHVFEYIMYGDQVCILTIPENAQTVVLYDKRKSDRIIIDQIMPLWTVETISYLVENGADIHAKNDQALRWTSKDGRLDVVQYLVSVGANIHAKDDYALRYASAKGHLDVLQYLVSIGANIHAKNDQALRWASEDGRLDMVKYLVSVGANIHAKDDYAIRRASANGFRNVVTYLQNL